GCPAGSTSSSTGSCRSCSAVGFSGANTKARRCGKISACRGRRTASSQSMPPDGTEDRPMKRQLHLNLFFHSRGHHEASWRHPATSPLALTDIRYYQDLARRAEARFDSIFLADQLALGTDVAQAARTWLEPITVLAALAVSTSRIGLIATASTTYTEPSNP